MAGGRHLSSPWIVTYLSAVSRTFPNPYTTGQIFAAKKVQITKILQPPEISEDGSAWALISDGEVFVPAHFSQTSLTKILTNHTLENELIIQITSYRMIFTQYVTGTADQPSVKSEKSGICFAVDGIGTVLGTIEPIEKPISASSHTRLKEWAAWLQTGGPSSGKPFQAHEKSSQDTSENSYSSPPPDNQGFKNQYPHTSVSSKSPNDRQNKTDAELLKEWNLKWAPVVSRMNYFKPPHMKSKAINNDQKLQTPSREVKQSKSALSFSSSPPPTPDRKNVSAEIDWPTTPSTWPTSPPPLTHENGSDEDEDDEADDSEHGREESVAASNYTSHESVQPSSNSSTSHGFAPSSPLQAKTTPPRSSAALPLTSSPKAGSSRKTFSEPLILDPLSPKTRLPSSSPSRPICIRSEEPPSSLVPTSSSALNKRGRLSPVQYTIQRKVARPGIMVPALNSGTGLPTILAPNSDAYSSQDPVKYQSQGHGSQVSQAAASQPPRPAECPKNSIDMEHVDCDDVEMIQTANSQNPKSSLLSNPVRGNSDAAASHAPSSGSLKESDRDTDGPRGQKKNHKSIGVDLTESYRDQFEAHAGDNPQHSSAAEQTNIKSYAMDEDDEQIETMLLDQMKSKNAPTDILTTSSRMPDPASAHIPVFVPVPSYVSEKRARSPDSTESDSTSSKKKRKVVSLSSSLEPLPIPPPTNDGAVFNDERQATIPYESRTPSSSSPANSPVRIKQEFQSDNDAVALPAHSTLKLAGFKPQFHGFPAVENRWLSWKDVLAIREKINRTGAGVS